MSEIEEKRDEILYLEKYAILDIETATAELKLFNELKGVISKDGNMFGAVVGCLSTGCSGFAETRAFAVRDCIYNYWNEKAVKENK